MLLRDGKLDDLKNGPLYWVDTSDSQPCLGCASAAMWTLTCTGRLFHSGLPHKVRHAYISTYDQYVHINDMYICDHVLYVYHSYNAMKAHLHRV